MTQTLTHRYATCIATSQPDATAIACARLGVLDWLASAAAGLDDPAYRTIRQTFLDCAGVGDGLLIGGPAGLDRPTAALLNATLGHAIDFDDIHPAVRGHPSTVILPALLAFAQDRTLSADTFLAAYATGIEALARLGRALGYQHYEAGFHNTATLGGIGAVAAIGRLLSMEPTILAQALGLAATQAGGLRLQFPTDIKPLHAGFAARAAVTAVLLSQAGIRASSAWLDGPIGFLSAFGLGGNTNELCVAQWGQPWEITSPGLLFKPFPCCGATHLPAHAALRLRAQHGITAETIKTITVTFQPGGDAALVVRKAQHGQEGRFSVEYVVALALLRGQILPSDFTRAPIAGDVAALALRVSRQTDPKAPPIGLATTKRAVRVDITTYAGDHWSLTQDSLPPFDPAEKFLNAPAAAGFATPQTLAHIRTMSSAQDLQTLLGLLSSSGQ